MGIKSYIFKKFFLPKNIIINRPGVILTKTVQKYGESHSQSRIAYVFEDVIADLQLETKKDLGEKETAELWYRIGKDSIASYLISSNARRPPSFLMGDILSYILSRFLVVGLSFSDISFDEKNMILITKGKNNVIHRKTKIGEIYAGGISEVVSFLSGRNIEAESSNVYENGELFCRIECNRKLPKRYAPNYKQIREIVSKNSLPKINPAEIFLKYREYATFDKFVKFNQIEILDNLTLFCDESLVSGEINFSGCIVRNYENCGLRDFLKRSVVLSSERKIKKILKARRLEKKRDKLKFIQNMMSGFGWGIPLCRLYKNKIIFDIILGANAKSNSFLFFALQLNGFLNAVFGRKINLERTEEVKDCLVSRAIYSF